MQRSGISETPAWLVVYMSLGANPGWESLQPGCWNDTNSYVNSANHHLIRAYFGPPRSAVWTRECKVTSDLAQAPLSLRIAIVPVARFAISSSGDWGSGHTRPFLPQGPNAPSPFLTRLI